MENKIHIELQELAPTLASMEKTNPFRVPDGYFEKLENQTLAKTGSSASHDQSLPEGYFESLSDRILEKVEVKTEAKVVPFYQKKWFSIAASFAFILAAIYSIQTQLSTTSESTEFAFEIDVEEALDYLADTDDIYLSDLMSLDINEEYLEEEFSDIELLEDSELDDILNELDQEQLEDLL